MYWATTSRPLSRERDRHLRITELVVPFNIFLKERQLVSGLNSLREKFDVKWYSKAIMASYAFQAALWLRLSCVTTLAHGCSLPSGNIPSVDPLVAGLVVGIILSATSQTSIIVGAAIQLVYIALALAGLFPRRVRRFLHWYSCLILAIKAYEC